MAKFLWYIVLVFIACHNSRSGSCDSLMCAVQALKSSSEIKQIEIREGKTLIQTFKTEIKVARVLELLGKHKVISTERNEVTKRNTLVVIFYSGREIPLFFNRDKVFYNGVNYLLLGGDLLSSLSKD